MPWLWLTVFTARFLFQMCFVVLAFFAWVFVVGGGCLFVCFFFFNNSLFMSFANPAQVHCLLSFCLSVLFCTYSVAMFGKRMKKEPSQPLPAKFIIWFGPFLGGEVLHAQSTRGHTWSREGGCGFPRTKQGSDIGQTSGTRWSRNLDHEQDQAGAKHPTGLSAGQPVSFWMSPCPGQSSSHKTDHKNGSTGDLKSGSSLQDWFTLTSLPFPQGLATS